MSAEQSSNNFHVLLALAFDQSWSWNHGGDEIWRTIDSKMWDLTHNPYAVLISAPRDLIDRCLADASFRQRVDDLVQLKRRRTERPTWFQVQHAGSPLTCVAYFSMEFMLSPALPIYSGGLGNVAGDQLKAASDLGVPVIGVGLLYQQGYFRQIINADGAQQALFPYNDPGQLPIRPLRRASGEWLRLEIELPGYSVWLRAWEVQVGRSKLYLLDSSDLANMPAHRGITAELYGGDACMRLKQEIVLGMGGWRLLRALGLQPEVCHLNEGHAALAILVRARDFMRESGQPFDVALSVTRAGNLFTTHTAVAAGFDRYEPSMFERYLGPWAAEHLGLKPTELLALGRANPRDATESFNMAYLAVRGSGAVNGVSRLHGEVSRRLFAPLFPRWPLGEVPIGHVTNGVHVPTWDSSEADAVWTEACGQGRWLGATETLTGEVRAIPLARLWQMRNAGRKSTIDYALRHLKLSMAVAGATPAEVAATKPPLDPNVLTLGFARRFATYKRPTLLLHDPQRLMRLLTDSRHPAQLLIAGKAHPADLAGQALIHDWTRFIRQQSPAPPVVFLDDYDMLMAEYLVQGVDVWLNTPQRPWEASGTSGMKVLVNGGLNLSELDGWWAEAYAPEVGWALGDGREHGGDPAWDAAEADELYRHLEHEVIPEFYARGADGIPNAWVARIRESMARLTPQFSANRTVREYTEAHYLPAAAAYRARAARQGFWGRSEITWRSALQQHWPHLSLGPLTGRRAGDRQEFELVVHLQGLDPDAVRVELYAESDEEADPVRQEMTPAGGARDAADGSLFHASVPAGRPTKDYTARLIPRFDGLSIPLEADQISWQR